MPIEQAKLASAPNLFDVPKTRAKPAGHVEPLPPDHDIFVTVAPSTLIDEDRGDWNSSWSSSASRSSAAAVSWAGVSYPSITSPSLVIGHRDHGITKAFTRNTHIHRDYDCSRGQWKLIKLSDALLVNIFTHLQFLPSSRRLGWLGLYRNINNCSCPLSFISVSAAYKLKNPLDQS